MLFYWPTIQLGLLPFPLVASISDTRTTTNNRKYAIEFIIDKPVNFINKKKT